VLFLLEWRRIPERSERLLWPVVICSAVYAIAGVAVLLGLMSWVWDRRRRRGRGV